MKITFKHGPHYRKDYWSNSRLADFLRTKVFKMEPKPSALTWEDWKLWKKRGKEKSPIGYYICEDLSDTFQDIVYFPKDIVDDIRITFTNWLIDKSHVLDTKLPRGSYVDLRERIFLGIMEELVDYVEVSLAYKHFIHNNKDKTVKDVKRNKEYGISYLEWEISLGSESPQQSRDAAKVLKIYKWYTEDYKKMKENLENNYTYEKEDELLKLENKMLKKVIDIRLSLWC